MRFQSFDRSSLAAFGALAALLVCAWAYVVFSLDLSYWFHRNEMAELNLGFALNIDHWLSGDPGKGRRSTFNAYTSPAIVQQYLSWIAYRLSDGLNFTPAPDLALKTLEDPQAFFLFSRLLALLVAFWGLWKFFRLAQSNGVWAVLSVLSACLIYVPLWEHGLLFLESASISLLISAFFVQALQGTLGAERSGLKVGAWIFLGFFSAMAYAIKQQYIIWFFAALGGIGLAFLGGRMTFTRSIKSLLLMVLGLALGLELIAVALAGKFTFGEIGRMFAFHANVLLGNNQEAVTALAGSDNSISAIFTPSVLLNLAPHFIIPLLALWLLLRGADQEERRAAAPFIGVFLLAACAGFAAFVLFPSEKYFISTAVLLPGCVLWIVKRLRNDWHLRILAMCLVLASANCAYSAVQRERAVAAPENDLLLIRDQLLSRPLEAGEIRLWAYRILSPEYNVRLSIQWSGLREYHELVGNKLFPQDREYNIWRKAVRYDGAWHLPNDLPWRYAFFPGQIDDISELPEGLKESVARLEYFEGVTIAHRRR